MYLLFFSACLAIVNGLNTNPCRTCKFFMPHSVGGKYEVGNYFGRCRKFGYIDVNTHEINYLFAHTARANEKRCGKEGKYYEENLDAPRTEEYL
jgi:hypothetical protein